MRAKALSELQMLNEQELLQKLEEFANNELNTINNYLSVYCQIKFVYENWRTKAHQALERNADSQRHYLSKAVEWGTKMEEITKRLLDVNASALREGAKNFYLLLENADIDGSLKIDFYEAAEEIVSLNEDSANALKEAYGGTYKFACRNGRIYVVD